MLESKHWQKLEDKRFLKLECKFKIKGENSNEDCYLCLKLESKVESNIRIQIIRVKH